MGKRIAILLMVMGVLIVSLAACGNSEVDVETNATTTSSNLLEDVGEETSSVPESDTTSSATESTGTSTTGKGTVADSGSIGADVLDGDTLTTTSKVTPTTTSKVTPTTTSKVTPTTTSKATTTSTSRQTTHTTDRDGFGPEIPL